jgi:hypothetical protein
MAAQRIVSTPAVIGLVALAAAGVAAFGYAEFGGWTADGAGAAARYTARFSFPIFIAAWSASALATLWPGGWRSVMLRRRRAIGLSFAAAHFVHFVALLIAVLVFAAQPSAKTIYGAAHVRRPGHRDRVHGVLSRPARCKALARHSNADAAWKCGVTEAAGLDEEARAAGGIISRYCADRVRPMSGSASVSISSTKWNEVLAVLPPGVVMIVTPLSSPAKAT